MVFIQKRVKILIVSLFQLKFDDVTVMLSLSSPCYYLTSYRNLLRLNVILMVRIIGQLLLIGGLPPPAPSLCFILEPRYFFMDRRPKDEPTAKNLVCKKLFPFPRKIGKTCGAWHPPPPPPPVIRINSKTLKI